MNKEKAKTDEEIIKKKTTEEKMEQIAKNILSDDYLRGWKDAREGYIKKEDILKLIEYMDKRGWYSRKIGYKEHKCEGTDGADISFTKKTWEEFKQKIEKLGEEKMKIPIIRELNIKYRNVGFAPLFFLFFVISAIGLFFISFFKISRFIVSGVYFVLAILLFVDNYFLNKELMEKEKGK